MPCLEPTCLGEGVIVGLPFGFCDCRYACSSDAKGILLISSAVIGDLFNSDAVMCSPTICCLPLRSAVSKAISQSPPCLLVHRCTGDGVLSRGGRCLVSPVGTSCSKEFAARFDFGMPTTVACHTCQMPAQQARIRKISKQ